VSQRIAFRGFVGSAFNGRSPRFDTQDLWNWHVERAETPTAKAGQMLVPSPGFELFVLLPTSPVRGLFAQNDRTFAVAGDTLYELTTQATFIERPQTILANPGAPVITNSPLAVALTVPLVPIVTHGGTIGSTTYGYVVTALKKFDDTTTGETSGSPEGSSAYGNATLSGTNWNIISWTAVEHATGYKIYRKTGGTAPPVLLATLASTTSASRAHPRPRPRPTRPPRPPGRRPTATRSRRRSAPGRVRRARKG
jgi:hypothetical protein